MTGDDREARREEVPFDEDPPIDPGIPQVGNSRARFVVPSEDADPPGEERPDEGRPGEEREGRPAE